MPSQNRGGLKWVFDKWRGNSFQAKEAAKHDSWGNNTQLFQRWYEGGLGWTLEQNARKCGWKVIRKSLTCFAKLFECYCIYRNWNCLDSFGQEFYILELSRLEETLTYCRPVNYQSKIFLFMTKSNIPLKKGTQLILPLPVFLNDYLCNINWHINVLSLKNYKSWHSKSHSHINSPFLNNLDFL